MRFRQKRRPKEERSFVGDAASHKTKKWSEGRDLPGVMGGWFSPKRRRLKGIGVFHQGITRKGYVLNGGRGVKGRTGEHWQRKPKRIFEAGL